MSRIIIESILYVFGLGDNPYHIEPRKSDQEYLASDWRMVGEDIKSAMDRYEQQAD